MEIQNDKSVRTRFFAPVDLALTEVNEGRRKCPSVSDRDHIISGIGRVLGTEKSDRGWVQYALRKGRVFPPIHLNRNPNPNPNLDLNLLVENGLSR